MCEVCGVVVHGGLWCGCRPLPVRAARLMRAFGEIFVSLRSNTQSSLIARTMCKSWSNSRAREEERQTIPPLSHAVVSLRIALDITVNRALAVNWYTAPGSCTAHESQWVVADGCCGVRCAVVCGGCSGGNGGALAPSGRRCGL